MELDGETADLHPVNYLLRGTSLPAGGIASSFATSRPRGRVGWIISVVALAVLIGAIAVGLRGWRSPSP